MIFLKKSFGSKPFRLLDIGAGNHSATKIKRVFPECEYSAVDIERGYNYSEEDFSLMKEFYELDLTQLNFSDIPENHFDGIWMVHVIEHLHNGDDVIKGLLPKLKNGGYLYIEYPGKKSMTLPSMYGTLNFHDDPTHVRLYSVRELTEIFQSQNCTVLKKGTRRNPWYLMAMTFRIIASALRGKKLNANVFWDVTGFAEYLWVRKN